MAQVNVNIDGADKSSPVQTPSSEPTRAQVEAAKAAAKIEEMNTPYVDKRYVTISLVHNYSNYRRVNMKVLGQRKETIGSSVRSCPSLIGCRLSSAIP